MRFGATLMCGTISVHVTLVVLFVFIFIFIKATCNGEELGLQTVFVRATPFLSCFFGFFNKSC